MRMVLVTGQSLALATDGDPAITTSAEHTGLALEWSGSAIVDAVNTSLERPMVQLVGGLQEAYADQEGGSPKVIGVVSAKGGSPYRLIGKRGTDASEIYGKLVGAVGRTMAAASEPVEVVSFHIIHGESDANEAVTQDAYKRSLRAWVRDADIDARGRTGQTSRVRGFGCQVSSWRLYQTTPTIALAQLDAHRDPNIDFTLVCPKYQLPYDGGATGTPHLSNIGYYKLGELHARAAAKVLIEGTPWHPVSPKSVTLSGSTITARFHVPTGPLQFDTTTVAAQTDYGFTAWDNGVAATISSVSITAADTVTVVLASPPSGTVHLGYAYKGGVLTTDWPFGNLCDSDTATSGYDDAPLRNWCVCFYDEAVAA